MKNKIKKLIPFKIQLLFYRLLNGNFNYLFWLFPIQNNKIVVCNFFGKSYGDNGKYIVEKLLEENKMDYEVVWLLNNKNQYQYQYEIPNYIKVVEYKSLKGLYELATARVWIDNTRKVFYPPKKKNQFYIQTWHGGISLKKIERDVEDKLSNAYLHLSKHDSKMTNLLLSNSDFCTELYRTAFWYKGDILECGSPRCDILMHNSLEIEEKVKRHFNINSSSQILTYAPTFRVDSNTEIYNIDFEQLISVLKKKFGGEWIVLVRLHPNLSAMSNFMEYTSSIIDATNYADMYEILAASEILLTDYSSTMFEFSFMNKPVVLYAPDINSYVEDRDFYFDIHTLPYPLAENTDQLLKIIERYDSNKYKIQVNEFLLKLGIKENGDASNQVVKKIKQIIMK
ncbi:MULTISPECIES: CDP-glycerol glycerophosphotransferase family protein [Paenibacillus]|uniref:CDP-glycerol glycerophosphotransferase family protein n=1 Tax=Paenibacillus TaxID=44249 RepID=UPI00096CF02B|nr:CDP-glycerol glycerophosphotransferase family protein [Paenibacillus odorifer]OMD77134.1 hypothetical protein BSK53_25815 [Paenibacillus odorifer]